MLLDLHIKNLAVLEQATIEFGTGFNVLSGETGAGKSIVVDSLALLAGVRASSDQIRTGAETLTVTGVFRPDGDAWRSLLAQAGVEPDGEELMIRREIQRSGRNRVFVNDQPATVRLLEDLSPLLLRLHGQREELGLVDPELQRTWLDRSGGAESSDLLAQVRAAFAAWKAASDRLERLSGDERMRQERIDLLRFQLSELDDARIEAGEEVELRREREVLRHAEAIRGGLGQAAELLFETDGSAYEALSKAARGLEAIASWEPDGQRWASELREIEIRLGEIEPDLRRRFDQVESDPGRLDAVEARLATLERLFRKYGADSHGLMVQRDELVSELGELEDAEGNREALEHEASRALDGFRAAADRLSTARRSWARDLQQGVSAELADLALDKAVFEVSVATRKRLDSPLVVAGEPVEFSELGFDQVVYLFSPNPGEDLRPLARVASGGELSRLYLAVQLASRGAADAGDRPVSPQPGDSTGTGPTLVFDEVDAGISGAEAAVLGAKLRRLAGGSAAGPPGQVLAVTHLPQVASQADVHFKVRKQIDDGRTRTRVERLEDAGRVDEVARMLAGSEITELSRTHARELIG
ncbi:MAG: DNA repair protein RecN, partial [Thermoanaerobaculia bacterium]|nr:DNA repair protein RecN [Thermoanaerobaculia bacterium]